MLNLLITTGSIEEFQDQGKTLARALDQGQEVEPRTVIMFEDPEELLEILSNARLSVFRSVKQEPGSITDVARRLGRDRSAVKRDVDVLVRAGLLEMEEVRHPGHGRKKYLKAAASELKLVAHLG
ncbi:HVO_A0114 family putative DNA-binding protein [Geomesophilobacter sediminis]|uniref:MarR family transcriptional regulator n=1 Tax=Geomesophilobacter sediminis TaxID=2798584 RepID=A0A8J7JMX5_9BACT|nr:helix-turn-helix domain-containing protein [Geomesophilobacter sediminis]MBJ6726245.1 MarR family transcriptional regulator [Geomesophilobacter sediminis]